MKKSFISLITILYIGLHLIFPTVSFATSTNQNPSTGTPSGEINEDPIGTEIPLISPLGEDKTFTAGEGALEKYINNLYLYAIGLGALLALGVIVFGAIRYMTEGGNSFRQSNAKAWIFGGVIGLILLISATLILTTLNSSASDISLGGSAVKKAERRAADAAAEAQATLDDLDNRNKSRYKELARVAVNDKADRWLDGNSFTTSGSLGMTQAALSILEGEYSLRGLPGEEEGYLEGLQDVIDKYPGFLEEYCKLKAAQHESLASPGVDPTSRLDDRGTPAGSELPNGCLEIMQNYHHDRRYDGTIYEMEEVSQSRDGMWDKLIDISNRGEVSEITFPGHLNAKDGVYEAFVEMVGRNWLADNVTPQNFLDYATNRGIDNWLTQRIKAGIELYEQDPSAEGALNPNR